jgi:hypothetical protein
MKDSEGEEDEPLSVGGLELAAGERHRSVGTDEALAHVDRAAHTLTEAHDHPEIPASSGAVNERNETEKRTRPNTGFLYSTPQSFKLGRVERDRVLLVPENPVSVRGAGVEGVREAGKAIHRCEHGCPP